jgi:hypothetical protein
VVNCVCEVLSERAHYLDSTGTITPYSTKTLLFDLQKLAMRSEHCLPLPHMCLIGSQVSPRPPLSEVSIHTLGVQYKIGLVTSYRLTNPPLLVLDVPKFSLPL